MFHTWITRKIRGMEAGAAASSFDGARPIKGDAILGMNTGATTVNEFLEDVFFPFVQAMISLNSGTSYYETGTEQNISLSGLITANDETVFSNAIIDISDGSTINLPSIAGNYQIQDDGIVVDVDYTAQVEVGGNGTPNTIVSAKKYIRFIYASYFGENTTGIIPTAAEIKLGTKRIVTTNSYFINNPETTGEDYGWFAVPKNQTGKIYTTWFVVVGNDGAIGSGQFIKSPTTVVVDEIDYDVYIYGYASELTNNLKLS